MLLLLRMGAGASQTARWLATSSDVVETGKESETVNGRVTDGFLWVQPDQVGGGPKCGSGAPDVQNEVFSLLNRLKPGRGVLWPNFNEPECLMTKCSKVGVRRQRTITLDVQQTIIPILYVGALILGQILNFRSALIMGGGST